MPTPSAAGGHHYPAKGKRLHRSKNKGKAMQRETIAKGKPSFS